MLKRRIQPKLIHHLDRGKSILLLGPRQTGKTTLIQSIPHDRYINLMDTSLRRQYEQNPSTLIQEITAFSQPTKKPLIIIDEVQKCPELMNSIQLLIDENIAQFIITGSSARKLRRHSELNLLPGRVISLVLSPLITSELPTPLVIEEEFNYGALPGVRLEHNNEDKNQDLMSYADTYLEEEIRAESLVRDLGPFSRFLQLSAMESGKITNFTKLSNVIGVSHITVKEYYQILEDCLIAIRIDPLINYGGRRRLVKSSRYIYFDLGVRRVCAKENTPTPERMYGDLFEQWVALAIWRWQHYFSPMQKLYFWRDLNGIEVDWIIDANQQLTPIEVKWTNSPSDKDIRHLKTFISEYSNAKQGIVVCRIPHKRKLTENITAIPWQELENFLETL